MVFNVERGSAPRPPEERARLTGRRLDLLGLPPAAAKRPAWTACPGHSYLLRRAYLRRLWLGMSTESPPDDLKQILGPNESVQLYLKQKIYHPKINIDSVVITNQRVILRHPHALGLKKDYTDYNYQDVSNVVLNKGVLRSTLSFTLRFGGEPLTLDAIPNDEAQKAYGLVRENLVRFQAPLAAATMASAPPPAGGAGYCNKCGAPLAAGQRFCGKCGAEVASDGPTVIEKEVVKVRCTYCGFLNDATDAACKSCGAKL